MLVKYLYQVKQNRFFWQGITCLFGLVLLTSAGLIGLTQATVNPGPKISFAPDKITGINFIANTNLDISAVAPTGYTCQYSYKEYKASQWIPLSTTNCQAALTKSMRSNNLVIDIKLVMTSGLNPEIKLSDSYVFNSK